MISESERQPKARARLRVEPNKSTGLRCQVRTCHARTRLHVLLARMQAWLDQGEGQLHATMQARHSTAPTPDTSVASLSWPSEKGKKERQNHFARGRTQNMPRDQAKYWDHANQPSF